MFLSHPCGSRNWYIGGEQGEEFIHVEKALVDAATLLMTRMSNPLMTSDFLFLLTKKGK